MKVSRLFGLIGIILVAGFVSAQDGTQRGKIVKLDLDANTITLKVGDGKEREAHLTEQTQVFEAKGATRKEKLQSFKVGAEVRFRIVEKDGKNFLFGIAPFIDKQQPPAPAKTDLTKLIPLNEMGTKEYQGFKGGFYPDGANERPKAHEAAGLKLAKSVQPLDADGKPDPNGKIVFLSVGMSNTSQASDGFRKVLAKENGKNPHLIFVNGAVGGQTAVITQSTTTPQGAKYWAIVDQRLQEAKLTRAQVQAIWIKQADGGPTQGFPAYAKKLEEELVRTVQIFPERFPNAKLVYLSSRTFGGYATTRLNPEPYAYESGFSVKWLIERQIKGEPDLNYDPAKGAVKAPWLSWGPYLWANGMTKRADGFYYEEGDFGKDGTHHSPVGSEKIGRHMLQFFKNDATTKSWFGR
jgi:Cu/Ag efflux protein CusF